MARISDFMTQTDEMLYSRLIRGNNGPTIQSRLDANLQLYGAWLYGGCMVASGLSSLLDDNIGEPTQNITDTLAKYCALRVSYTFLRTHPDFSQRIGEGENRRNFYQDLVYPMIHVWWSNDQERTKIFDEYLVLDSQFAYDLQQERSQAEANIFYSQILSALRDDLSVDIRKVDVPIRDVLEIAMGGAGLLNVGIVERTMIARGITNGLDAAVSTLRDWPRNWLYPVKIPPNLFADSYAGGSQSKAGGGCGSLMATAIGVVTISILTLALFL